MAYHETDELTYIFGGATDTAVVNTLLSFDGSHLKEVKGPEGPVGRTFASMAYYGLEESLVLFGGNKVLFGQSTDAKNLLNDTWVFKKGQWKKLNTPHSPRPRAEAAISYDPKRKRLILFGGYAIEGTKYIKLNDTWEFYDNDWHLASIEGPSARNGATMSYDPSSKSVILFGGSTEHKDYGPGTGQTWSWNGKSWTKLKTKPVANIFNAAMSYDADEQRLIRFGGWNGDARTDETWAFASNEWTLINVAEKPAARNHAQMVYDSKNKSLIIFGGHDGELIFGDLWIFRKNKWEQIMDTAPRKRVKNGH
jgi:hypothetical protein